MGRILNPVFNEFTSWCAGKKNSSVNQIVTKRTAHPPSFETGQMCSSIYTPLVFKQLKRQLHPEVNSLKWLFGSWRGGASLLLRKEWRNAGKRDSLEGVQKRSTVKVGLGEVLAIWGGVFLRIVIPKNYRRSNYGDSRLSSAAIWHEPNTRDSLKNSTGHSFTPRHCLWKWSGTHGTAKVYPKCGETVHLCNWAIPGTPPQALWKWS